MGKAEKMLRTLKQGGLVIAITLAAIGVGALAGAGFATVVRAADGVTDKQLVAPGVEAQNSAQAVLDVKTWLKATETLQAAFIQQGADGKLVRGTFTMKQPGQMRFEYEPDVPLLVVADRGSVFFIDYEVRQLSRYPIKETPLAPLLRPSALDTLPLNAIEIAEGPMAGTIAVTSADPDHREYGTLTMIFERAEADLILRAWTVLDAQGNLTTITLENVQTNIQVADAAFKFKNPERRGGPRGK